MSKQRFAELEAEIQRLRERVAALESRPVSPIVIPPWYPRDDWYPTRYPIIHRVGNTCGTGASITVGAS